MMPFASDGNMGYRSVQGWSVGSQEAGASRRERIVKGLGRWMLDAEQWWG
jgi:hypothetical protein